MVYKALDRARTRRGRQSPMRSLQETPGNQNSRPDRLMQHSCRKTTSLQDKPTRKITGGRDLSVKTTLQCSANPIFIAKIGNRTLTRGNSNLCYKGDKRYPAKSNPSKRLFEIDGDAQLLKLTLLFLVGNRLVRRKFPEGKWIVTDRGQAFFKRYRHTARKRAKRPQD